MDVNDPGQEPGDSILDAVNEAFEPPPQGSPPEDEDRPDHGSDDRPDDERPEPPRTRQGARGGPATPRRTGPSPARPAHPRRVTLFSASPAERRARLEHLATRGVDTGQVEAVARVLAADPDPELRILAARTLGDMAGRVPIELLARALADPHDRVRAEVVLLIAGHGEHGLHLLLPLVTERRWPATQLAALAVVPRLLAAGSRLGDPQLERFLAAVGSLDPPPMNGERPGLEAMALAIGPSRLARSLSGPDGIRRGAARLVGLSRIAAALRALAAMVEDPIDEIRMLAAAAGRIAQAGGSPAAEPFPLEADRTDAESWHAEPALLGALARALGDPAGTVREQSIAALQGIPGGQVAAWVRGTLEGAGGEEAATAALVAGRLRIVAAARSLLERAAATPLEDRGPFVAALEELGLDPDRLVRLVTELDPAHRQAGVRLAWQVGGRSILNHLPSLLADSAGAVRMAVLEVLGASGDPAAASLAAERLANDSSAAVRATAVHVLAASDASTRRTALDQAMADPDPDVRATAVETLAGGSPDLVPLLLSAIHDVDRRVWEAAMAQVAGAPNLDHGLLWETLRSLQPERRERLTEALEARNAPLLTELAAQNARVPDPAERAIAPDLAARAGTSQATSLVVAALEDPDPSVRRTAAAAMNTLRSPAAVEALSKSLSDPQVEVRVEAVRALGLIDDDAVPDRLIEALKDPEVRVRDMAADALARWQSPAVARRVAAALSSPDLRRAAGEVLGRMGRVAVDALSGVAVSEDVEAAGAAGSLIERIAGPGPFIEGLSSIDPQERLRCVRILGAIGGPTASDALLGVLADPDVRVRSAAAGLLGALGYLPAVKPLRRMFLTDPVSAAAVAAERALRSLGVVPPGGEEVRVVEEVPQEQPDRPGD